MFAAANMAQQQSESKSRNRFGKYLSSNDGLLYIIYVHTARI